MKRQKVILKFANNKKFCYLCSPMIITFEEIYLQELYVGGKTSDKKHRFQPQIVSKYKKVINLMKQLENVFGLTRYGSLHYEKLHGNKEGVSSVRVNDQYRIEFVEGTEDGKQIATICNIIDLSNHYN
jgi:proteic killer suppression protein